MQKQVSMLLSLRLGKYTIRENHRPPWLDGMELDFYIEELRIAIEVQGQQHFQFVPFFHKDYDDFNAQQERDKDKAMLCRKNGIQLFHIFDIAGAHSILFDLEGVEVESELHPNSQQNEELPTYHIMTKEEIKTGRQIRACKVILRNEMKSNHPRLDRIAKYHKRVVRIFKSL